MVSTSFLSVSADKEEKCLICDEEFTKPEKLSSFPPAGWDTFKVQAEKWTLIDFLRRCEKYVYITLRYKRTLLK